MTRPISYVFGPARLAVVSADGCRRLDSGIVRGPAGGVRRISGSCRLIRQICSRLYPIGSARLGMKSEQLGVVAIALVAASFLCAPTTPASANPVLPGGTVTPDLFGAISGSVLATTGTVPLTSVPASFMSTYVAEVVADAGRGGLLDFILQTTNSPASGDALGRITLTSFAGFATDVGAAISAGGLAGGTAPPVNIPRSSAGNVIGFNFAPGVLSPGTTSEVLVVETNATAFVPGTVLETDGGRRVVRDLRLYQPFRSTVASRSFWPSVVSRRPRA